jgi:hypothetical protein
MATMAIIKWCQRHLPAKKRHLCLLLSVALLMGKIQLGMPLNARYTPHIFQFTKQKRALFFPDWQWKGVPFEKRSNYVLWLQEPQQF